MRLAEACFPFDLNDEAMQDFPFLFSLTDYPGEGPPYQPCSSRVSVRVSFRQEQLFPCFHQLLLYSLPGLGAALSASVASTDLTLTQAGEADGARNERVSWSQHCDE
jgi:hypothetical protein